jgi:hypothetical protein
MQILVLVQASVLQVLRLGLMLGQKQGPKLRQILLKRVIRCGMVQKVVGELTGNLLRIGEAAAEL